MRISKVVVESLLAPSRSPICFVICSAGKPRLSSMPNRPAEGTKCELRAANSPLERLLSTDDKIVHCGPLDESDKVIMVRQTLRPNSCSYPKDPDPSAGFGIKHPGGAL